MKKAAYIIKACNDLKDHNQTTILPTLSTTNPHNLGSNTILLQGFRTGYIYRQPLVKGDPPKPRNDVEVPPAVSSLGYLLEEEEMYKTG